MSRRSLLRKSAATTVMLGIGIPAFSGSAAATNCARTPGYWMNHDWYPGPPADPTALEQVNKKVPGVYFPTVEDGQAFLKAPAKGDKGHIMATHLVAFVINNQAAYHPCVTTPVVDVGYGKEPINKVVSYARQWLDASGWTYGNGTKLTSWYVDGVPVSNGEMLKNIIDEFNNNRIDVDDVDCPCYNYND
nr:twin-arginine translocation signal domain-containing protein [Haloferax sp. CBA1150]